MPIAVSVDDFAIPAAFWLTVEPAREGERYLYAIQFDTGVLKVGVARDATARIGRHVFSSAIHQRRVNYLWVSTPHLNAAVNETALIAYCKQRGKAIPIGNEYFTGLAAERAARYAVRLPLQRAPKPQAALPRPSLPRPYDGEAPRRIPTQAAGAARLYPLPEIAGLTGLSLAWLNAADVDGSISTINLSNAQPPNPRMRRMTAEMAAQAIEVAVAQAAALDRRAA
ncbi:hypothetical protein ABT369_28230 [Dactylosporangium sp. NPDC000244]|uniref:hypothetical protein n=1 Tax=Dactylosporangium sp. NPDC000244 TaxID=3154365 RepID=UPI00332BFEBF